MEISTPATGRKKSYNLISSSEEIIIPAKERFHDIESSLPDEPRPDYSELWKVLMFVLLVFLTILAFSLRYSHLQSHMPAVRVLRIDVGKIGVVSTNIDSVVTMTANLAVFLEASNGEDKMDLLYSKMNASVEASGVQFGTVRLADVRQPPQNSTTLIVAAAVKDVVMDDRWAREFRSSAEAHVLVIDVSVKGRIDMMVDGRKTNGCPFEIECQSINESAIDAGRTPACSFDLTNNF